MRGVAFAEPIPQRIHSITRPPIYPGTPGEARPVTSADAELFAEWLDAFRAEAVPHEPRDAREMTDKMAASGRYIFWKTDGEPVSMAGIMRQTRNAIAIASVYTPPELRRRGYAGSMVATLVEQIYASCKTIVCLFTDLRNPASNRCYGKVGFQPVCDSWHFVQKPSGNGSAIAQMPIGDHGTLGCSALIGSSAN